MNTFRLLLAAITLGGVGLFSRVDAARADCGQLCALVPGGWARCVLTDAPENCDEFYDPVIGWTCYSLPCWSYNEASDVGADGWLAVNNAARAVTSRVNSKGAVLEIVSCNGIVVSAVYSPQTIARMDIATHEIAI